MGGRKMGKNILLLIIIIVCVIVLSGCATGEFYLHERGPYEMY